ncbi:MAG TPA: MFS transporter [Bacillota bacterium]|nr:MFS transporter [Bacillota bacterium]
MVNTAKPAHIIDSIKSLKGNTRISVLVEPLWGIPFSLYSFYLGLYMKGQGITSEQMGFLISIGFIASVIFAMLGGVITDALGRKRTTLIFDFLSWPLALLIYFFSGNFLMFALAQVVNSLGRIVAVSWNLMVVEDADPEQQVAAYNLINAINLSAGILTPLAGIIVKHYGIIGGEKIILVFGVISMSAMILVRNYFYRETQVGQQILDERKAQTKTGTLKVDLSLFKSLADKPTTLMALFFSILFNAYIPIGTFYSLYYAPFLTEILKLDKAAIAILGGINAGVVLAVFLLLIPLLNRFNRACVLVAGIILQISALLMFITIPPGNFFTTAVAVIIFALGFGMVKPFIDSILANATAGKERAGIYAIHNTLVSFCSAGLGLVSGYLYALKPLWIYLISIVFLLICIGLLLGVEIHRKENHPSQT